MDNYSIIIEDVLQIIIKSLKKEKNNKKIKMYILNPLTDYILSTLKPYLILSGILVLTILSLLITITATILK
jgi:hypothetical protein